MWNDNDIFANDIAEKFEQRMFCNFGGGSSSSSSGGEPRGVTISGGTLKGGRASSSSTGGGDTGGYDVLGTGAVGDPTRGGQVTLADISGGDSDDQAYVDAIRQNVQRQVELSQNYRDLLDQGRNIDYQNYFDLARRSGIIPSQFGSGGGFSLEGLLGGQYNIADLVKRGFNNHPIVQAGRYIGQNASRQLMEGLQKGYKPQYNAIGQIVATYDPETGRYGAGSVISRIDPNNPANIAPPPMDFGDDGGDFVAPEATAVAVSQPEEVREPNFPMDYRYPAGGDYQEEGMYQRMGLLDVAPMQFGGLLAGYDQPQFAEMNVGFRQPTDVGLFQDPYDVTGYSLV